MATSGQPQKKGSPLVWIVAAVLILGAGGVGAWWWFTRDDGGKDPNGNLGGDNKKNSEKKGNDKKKNDGKEKPEPDMVAIMDRNMQGVGLMEMFDYQKAEEVFERIVEDAPDWIPGRINLAIAYLNVAGIQEDVRARFRVLQKAQKLLDEVLVKEPGHSHALFNSGIIQHELQQLPKARPFFEKVTKKDPADAASWYWLAESLPPKEIDKAIEYLEKAYRLDPHLYQAIFALRTKLRISGRDVARADVLFKEERLLSPAAHDDQFGNIVQKAYGD